MSIKRLTIQLPIDQHEFLQREAKRTGIAVTEPIRRLIDDLQLRSDEVSKVYQTDPLYQRRGSFDGPEDLSEHHDQYLYEKSAE